MVGDTGGPPWAEPRAPRAPARVWRDPVLVVVVVTAAVVEATLREDLAWRPVALVLVVAPALALLWRRTHPLLVVALAFGAQAAVDLTTLLDVDGSVVLYSSAYVVVLPYAVLRWGSGREAATGLAIVLAAHVLRELANPTGLGDAAFAGALLLSSAALGAAVRYRASSRSREIDQVRLREREQLARELHDTVAHHVSAIAIHAQAGRALASSRPGSAVAALEVIEGAASRALGEMRSVVGVLRAGQEADLAPQRGVGDIERLARSAGDGPRVEVELSGDLDDLRPSVDAALFRLAQESVTNALRHARRATRVEVRVDGDGERVRLTVDDDGRSGSTGRSSSGYGLVGMAERVALLGGTLEAGPGPDGGWTVRAVLPRAAGSVR